MVMQVRKKSFISSGRTAAALVMLTASPLLFAFDYYDAGKCVRTQGSGSSQVKPLSILYEHNFWGGRDDRNAYPTKSKVAEGASKLRPGLAVIDIEVWDDNENAQDEAARKYVKLVGDIKEIRKDVQVGFYGVVPKRNYYGAIAGTGSSERKKWVKSNDTMKGVADAADVILPSLYTFYPDQARWTVFAENQLKEARRLSGNKPVIAFIWPRYHESNRVLGGNYIGKRFFISQLDFLSKNADGVVVWDKSDNCILSEAWRKELDLFAACRSSDPAASCSDGSVD